MKLRVLNDDNTSAGSSIVNPGIGIYGRPSNHYDNEFDSNYSYKSKKPTKKQYSSNKNASKHRGNKLERAVKSRRSYD